MKNKSSICFPHPVAGVGDGISSTPCIAPIPIEVGKDDFIFHVELDINNEDIQHFIDNDYALYSCEIDCPTTFYRRIIKSKTPVFDITIQRKDVAERVNFDFTVTVIKRIENYTNSKVHQDYQGYYFNLEPGDLLAFIGKSHYDADISYEKLKSAGSFVTITKGHDEKNTNYYLRNPKIEIQLPPSLYEDYRVNYNGRDSFAGIFHSSLVLNALVYALMEYKEDEYGDKLWARTLKDRIELEPGLHQFASIFDTEEKDPQLIFLFAQTLLSNPYKRLFETIKGIDNQPTIQEGY